ALDPANRRGPLVGVAEHPDREITSRHHLGADVLGQPSGQDASPTAEVENPRRPSSPKLPQHAVVHGPVHRSLDRREVVEPRPEIEEPRPPCRAVRHGTASWLSRSGEVPSTALGYRGISSGARVVGVTVGWAKPPGGGPPGGGSASVVVVVVDASGGVAPFVKFRRNA